MKTFFIRRRTVVMFLLLGLCTAFIWFSMSNSYFDNQARLQIKLNPDERERNDKKTGVSQPDKSEAVDDAKADAALADIIAQEEKNGSEFYSEYRLQRDRIRSQQIDLLREIVNNPNSASETRSDAQQKLIDITQNLEREMELENLIIAKGFQDAIVLIQPAAVTIIVQGKSLTQEQLAKITDLAVRSLKVAPEDIVIVPKT